MSLSSDIVIYFQVLESEDFYSLSKDKLLELILSDELEIEDEEVIHSSIFFPVFFCLLFKPPAFFP